MSRNLGIGIVAVLVILSACKKKTSIEKAAELIEKGKYGEAIKAVKKGLAKDSLNTDLYFRLCQAYIGIDSLSRAGETYLELYRLDSIKADDENLKVYLANYSGLEPYQGTRITKTRSNEYAPYPSSSGLYFASIRFGSSRIYRLRNRRARRLRKIRGWSSDPVPVREGLCYSSGLDRNEEIYLYHFKEGQAEQLTDNDAGDYPSDANSNGDRLLFMSDRDGDWDVYLMDLEKREVKRVTKNDYLDGDARFTPDDCQMIFVTKIKGVERIAIADLNGKIKKVLPISEGRHPSFVDSSRIVYQGKGGRDWDLYLYDLKTKRTLTLTRNRRDDYRPTADIKDKKIYFVRKVRSQWDIFMIDLKRPIETKILIKHLEELTAKEKAIS